jgi:excisionase family DNA binding protein
MNADIKPAAGSDDPSAAPDPEPAQANIAHGNGRDDDVLDVEGATRLLRIGRNTIYELVGRNEIPHRQLGKQIRFSRAAIMRWLDPWSSQGAKKGH